jgi:hypothetical protein
MDLQISNVKQHILDVVNRGERDMYMRINNMNSNTLGQLETNSSTIRDKVTNLSNIMNMQHNGMVNEFSSMKDIWIRKIVSLQDSMMSKLREVGDTFSSNMRNMTDQQVNNQSKLSNIMKQTQRRSMRQSRRIGTKYKKLIDTLKSDFETNTSGLNDRISDMNKSLEKSLKPSSGGTAIKMGKYHKKYIKYLNKYKLYV